MTATESFLITLPRGIRSCSEQVAGATIQRDCSGLQIENPAAVRFGSIEAREDRLHVSYDGGTGTEERELVAFVME